MNLKVQVSKYAKEEVKNGCAFQVPPPIIVLSMRRYGMFETQYSGEDAVCTVHDGKRGPSDLGKAALSNSQVNCIWQKTGRCLEATELEKIREMESGKAFKKSR